MTLLLAMLPFYLLGNLHCMGMCGPLVMLLGHHRYRLAYFFGRTLSFTLIALLAAEMGFVLQSTLAPFHLSAIVSLLFGAVIVAAGVAMLLGRTLWGAGWFSGIERSLALLLLKDQMWPTFLFGFATVFLPCGQTLIVFSACALTGDPLTGLINGFAFALLTSPSLYFALQARRIFGRFKHYERAVMGSFALLIGFFALARGFADLEIIPHLVLMERYHIVLY